MNFQSVDEAFSKQSSVFDSLEEKNEILQWMRAEVHTHCLHHFKPGDQVLELNCGTGIDAIFFAEHGMHVHATDLSEAMLDELRNKIAKKKLSDKISVQQCSFTDISVAVVAGKETMLHAERSRRVAGQKKFNHIFSDFGGLNCVQDIEQVISQFKNLLQPDGTVTLVIMPPVCPWEILLAIKGNFKTAFRRFKKNGADSNVEGIHFKTYYFSPSRIINAFGNDYRKLSLKGLGCFTPPPYLEKFPKQFPRLFKFLTRLDKNLAARFPFNRCADHFILTMQLK